MPTGPRREDVVKLSSLSDIATAVPHLLGFPPSESVVALALRPPRDRIVFTLRQDLLPEQYDDDIARMVAARLAAVHAVAALLVVYTDGFAGGTLPRRGLVHAIDRRLRCELRDAGLVSDGRLWSYFCRDESCCPPAGTPLDAGSRAAVTLAAAHAMHGRALLPNRDAVVASVAPYRGIRAQSLRQACERAWKEVLDLDDEAVATRAHELLHTLLAAYAAPPALVDDDDAAFLVAALHDRTLRDQWVARALRRPEPALALLVDLARRALPPDDAPVCTVLAWVAYAAGAGVVATSALERALATDPDYQLALLLSEAIDRQVRPRELRAVALGLLGTPRRRAG